MSCPVGGRPTASPTMGLTSRRGVPTPRPCGREHRGPSEVVESRVTEGAARQPESEVCGAELLKLGKVLPPPGAMNQDPPQPGPRSQARYCIGVRNPRSKRGDL